MWSGRLAVSRLVVRKASNCAKWRAVLERTHRLIACPKCALIVSWSNASHDDNDPLVRYIRNARDLAAYVSMDHVFQAGYNAGIWLFQYGAPLNPGNPYLSLTNQAPFATFGLLHFLTLLGE